MDQPITLQLWTKDTEVPRLVVFEYDVDEGTACASVRDIIEGPRPFIERYIKDNYLGVPVYVRNDRPHQGEVMLFPTHDATCGGPIILPTVGLTARKIYDMLLEVESNPRPAWSEVMPYVTPEVIMERVLSGELKYLGPAGATYVRSPDKMTYIRGEHGLEITVENDVGAWEYNIHHNAFKRVR